MHILSSLSQCKVSVLVVVSVPFYIYQFIISHESNKQCQVFTCVYTPVPRMIFAPATSH